MNNKYQDLFQSLSYQTQFRPAMYFEHTSIDDYASELLSGILGRDIYAEGKRDEFYYWSIKFYNEPITKDELEKLYDILEASEYDREIQSQTNEYNENITELCQRISNKLFSKIMPFNVSVSHSDDDGIWLFGDEIDADILKTGKTQTINV